MLRPRHAVVVVLVLVATAGLAAAAPQGSPELSVFLPDDRVTAGDDPSLELFVLNGGNIEYGGSPEEERRITTARNVRITLRAGRAPVEVKTATNPVGNVPEGTTGPIRFAVSIDEDASPGTYRLPVRIEYKYTHLIATGDPSVPNHQEKRRSVTEHVTLRVEEAARFEIERAAMGRFHDDTGPVTLSIRNVGSEAATDARVTIASGSTQLSFAGQAAAETFVGEWRPGEVRRITVDGRLAEGADRRSYPVSATVRFEDDDGLTRTSDALSAGVTPSERTGRFAVVDVGSDLEIGDSGTVTLAVRNEGNETARDARLSLAANDPKLSFAGASTAETHVGDWGPGEVRRLSFEASLAAGADIRAYPMSATVTYKDPDGETRRSDPAVTSVTPDPRSDRFAVVNATVDLAVGDTGTVTLALRNVEDETARSARIAVVSGDPKLAFAGSSRSETFVGPWEPGQVRTVTFKASIAPGADVRSYPLSTSVTYENAEGEVRTTEPVATGIVPRPEQSFAVGDVRSTLAVGEEGTLRGRIENTGQVAVGNAVVVLSTENPNLEPIETEYSVGDLAPGEDAAFSFDVETVSGADAGPRQVTISVRYRDPNDDVQRSDPIDVRAAVGPKRDAFRVDAVNATLAAGRSGTLTLRVTNVGNETVTDVSAKLFADDPIGTSDDEAFIDRLEPRESARITFGVSAGGGALSKVYPVDVDFQYTDAEGDTLLSDTYHVPVTVGAAGSGGGRGPLPIVIGLLLAAALAGGGYYLYRRRGGALPWDLPWE